METSCEEFMPRDFKNYGFENLQFKNIDSTFLQIQTINISMEETKSEVVRSNVSSKII